jgi:type I restriction enzyme M protein
LVLERKTEKVIAVEDAAGKKRDYDVFMALANHIGHDKRGNVTYVRDSRGNEIVEEVVKSSKEWVDGKPVYRQQKIQLKVVDDNTNQIAEAFRAWVSEQA